MSEEREESKSGSGGSQVVKEKEEEKQEEITIVEVHDSGDSIRSHAGEKPLKHDGIERRLH